MTRGRENPACSITETGKRADSVRMLHSHHSPDLPPGPEAAGKSGIKKPGGAGGAGGIGGGPRASTAFFRDCHERF